jgi:gamma-glutamylcyclotransferase (GGCT)/AIG2-like uncharacterized protein YtfP
MLYFAYGTNISSQRMKERCKYFKKISLAKLFGYQFIFNQRGVATVVKKPGSTVWGVLYDIDKDALNALDGFEGYPVRYDRKKVEVRDKKDNTFNAIMYIDYRSQEGVARPEHKKIILKCHQDDGFPEKYINDIKRRYA